MSLPEYEEKPSYSQDEVRHIVAREVAKQQLQQLQSGQIELNKKMVEMVADFTAKLDGLTILISKQPEKMEKCRTELRREIEKDFPSKLEFNTMENHLKTQIGLLDKKVDMQWLKVTIPLAVLSALITGIGVVLNYFILISKLTN